MSARNIFPTQDSADEVSVIVLSTMANAVQHAHGIHPYPGETLGDITLRAYGANTPAFRERILKANPDLKGLIVATHG